MKKDIASQLNEVARTMPIVFEWELRPSVFTGLEMNLSGFGEHMKYDKEKSYSVLMPTMVAVEHKQQIKDAYKRGGLQEVKKYHRSVMDKIKKND